MKRGGTQREEDFYERDLVYPASVRTGNAGASVLLVHFTSCSCKTAAYTLAWAIKEEKTKKKKKKPRPLLRPDLYPPTSALSAYVGKRRHQYIEACEEAWDLLPRAAITSPPETDFQTSKICIVFTLKV